MLVPYSLYTHPLTPGHRDKTPFFKCKPLKSLCPGKLLLYRIKVADWDTIFPRVS